MQIQSRGAASQRAAGGAAEGKAAFLGQAWRLGMGYFQGFLSVMVRAFLS